MRGTEYPRVKGVKKRSVVPWSKIISLYYLFLIQISPGNDSRQLIKG
jgi:hypothetical protein